MATVWPSIVKQGELSMKVKWEYKTVKLGAGGLIGGKIDESKLECSMNDLGYEGWELVVIFDTNQGDGQTRDACIVFKRSRSS